MRAGALKRGTKVGYNATKVKGRNIDRRIVRPAGGGGLLAALDVGSTKVACIIGRVRPGGLIQLSGVGYVAARGLRAGTVVDMQAAEHAIGRAVQEAEIQAGETLAQLLVNISGGHPVSQIYPVTVDIGGRAITDEDLLRAVGMARATPEQVRQEVLHSLPVEFSIDGNRGVREPVGMQADRLGVRLHVVSAEAAALNNLRASVERCHLTVDGVVASSYASGLAVLLEDERELGTIVIDMGGGTTTISAFAEGHCLWVDTVGIGGQSVTNDIAKGLGTTIADAERLKTLHGHAMATSIHHAAEIDVPVLGDDERPQKRAMPRSALGQIIEPRLEETFELVRARLEAAGVGRYVGRQVVLTGGASQLPGARDLAQQMLGKQVRLGRPSRLAGPAGHTGSGLGELAANPAFATAAGLMTFAHEQPAELRLVPNARVDRSRGILSRVGRWLRESL
jgi:cell division protein FtsA